MTNLKMLKRLLFVCAIALQFSFAQTINFKIIETSDVHGNIFPYDFKNNKQINYSLAQVLTLVKTERNKDQEVILLDNGDILQGTPLVYYYNFEKNEVKNIYAEVMNFMDYDAATIGNHDIETGHPVYDKFDDELNMPWLAANAINTDTDKPYFKPYSIIERQGIKIAVLGLITPAIPNWLPEKIWEGIEFTDMIESANHWVKLIKENEKPDILIGLFHAGVDYNYNGYTTETPLNENASKLVAEQVPGFDIVFVGHDHQEWNILTKNTEEKKVLILGPLAGARNVAVANVKMTFDKNTNVWEKELSGEHISSSGYEPDQELLDKFSDAFNQTKEYVARPIGEFSKATSTRESIFGNSSFVDLIHEFQLQKTGADISLVAPLAFNSTISKGKIFVRDMFNLYKYENLLYTMELSGQEILDYLEYSYSKWFNTMVNENDNLLHFVKDENGNLILSDRYNSPQLASRYYNFSSAAGIIYTVDVSKPAGSRIEIKALNNGKKFSVDSKYKVALNSYRGNGGGGHLILGAKIPKENLSSRILNSTEKDLRYYLMKWIEEKQIVTPKAFGNWKVIPEEWYNKAKEKEYKLLFGK